MANSKLSQVAEEAGCSIQTVGRVLSSEFPYRRRGAAARAAKIREIAGRLNYLPSTSARGLRTQRTRQVGVLVANTPLNRFAYLAAYEMLLGINERLQADDYLMALIRIGDIGGKAPGDLAEPRVFRERAVDGLIVIDLMPPAIVRRVERYSAHTVWLDTGRDEPTGCVMRDEREAGRLAAERLIAAGYRELLFVGRDLESTHYSNSHRWQGVRAVADRHDVALRHVELDFCGDGSISAADMDKLATGRVAAVASDHMFAQRCLTDGIGRGLMPGRDYTLVSCDSCSVVDKTWPGLSRIDVDRFDLGMQGADMLLQEIKSGERPSASRLVRGRWIDGQTICDARQDSPGA